MPIGVDIEDINRFENKSQTFLDKIFSKGEQKYCSSKANPASHYAVRFCAKESVIKALNSMGLRQPEFNQIEIYHDENNCPKIRLLEGFLIKMPNCSEYNNLTIEVSLSHDKTKAVAFVTIVNGEK